MSASTSETNPQTGGAANSSVPRKKKRKARGPNKVKSAATLPRTTNGASTAGTILPSPARMAAMNERTKAVIGSAESIAGGYAKALLTAGPGWTPDYQKQFLLGLTASLPVICGAPAP